MANEDKESKTLSKGQRTLFGKVVYDRVTAAETGLFCALDNCELISTFFRESALAQAIPTVLRKQFETGFEALRTACVQLGKARLQMRNSMLLDSQDNTPEASL